MEGVRIFRDQDYLNTMRNYLHVDGAVSDSHNHDFIDLTNIVPADKIESGDFTLDMSSVSQLTVAQKKQLIQYDLKELLFGLAKHLFGQDITMKWREDFFPFTEPSFELDILFLKDGQSAPSASAATTAEEEDEKWLEVLGCGVVHDDVMKVCKERAAAVNARTGADSSITIGEHGWAFGLGLERLAMVLFSIPDIRLFWSLDPRFLKQFSGDKITTFVPFSKFPLCYKDVSFWLPLEDDAGKIDFHPNEVFEVRIFCVPTMC